MKIEQQVNYILLRVGNEGLKKYNTWLLTEEEKRTPEITFNMFIEQLKPKENFRINHLKLMTYKPEAEESLEDFVHRCQRMTERCLLSLRSFQFSRGPNFKKKARWLKIPSTWNLFCTTPTLPINTHFYFPTTKIR